MFMNEVLASEEQLTSCLVLSEDPASLSALIDYYENYAGQFDGKRDLEIAQHYLRVIATTKYLREKIQVIMNAQNTDGAALPMPSIDATSHEKYILKRARQLAQETERLEKLKQDKTVKGRVKCLLGKAAAKIPRAI